MSAKGRSPFLSVLGIVALIVLCGVTVYFVYSLTANAKAGSAASGSAIHQAALAGDEAQVRRLVAAGADVNASLDTGPVAQRGMTPLICAAYKGNPETIKVLLDKGARLEARAADGRTALIYAAGWGHAASVKALLAAGARADARADGGWTALMFAATRGEPDSVEALIAAGAAVNAKNKWRQDPLMCAARSGSTKKVRMLLDNGADPTAADVDGATALSIAAGTTGVDPAIFRMLINAGAHVNGADHAGVTPLMKAAQRGDKPQVEALLAAGADPSLKDSNGWTALDWAKSRQDELGASIANILSKSAGG